MGKLQVEGGLPHSFCFVGLVSSRLIRRLYFRFMLKGRASAFILFHVLGLVSSRLSFRFMFTFLFRPLSIVTVTATAAQYTR